MKINGVFVWGHGSGKIEVSLGEGMDVAVQLTREEQQEITSLAERIYERKQQKIVTEAAKPFKALADFSEISDDQF